MLQKLKNLLGGPLKPCAGRWRESILNGGCFGQRKTFPMQPVNSYTNLSYLIVGILVALILANPWGWVFMGAMSLLTVGSFLYHAWPTTRTAALDHAGMYAVFICLVVSAIGGAWWVVAIASMVGACLFRYAFSNNLNSMMGLFLFLALVATGLTPMALYSLLFFATAMVTWLLDRHSNALGKWGHGLWHIYTAIAIGAMFLGIFLP